MREGERECKVLVSRHSSDLHAANSCIQRDLSPTRTNSSSQTAPSLHPPLLLAMIVCRTTSRSLRTGCAEKLLSETLLEAIHHLHDGLPSTPSSTLDPSTCYLLPLTPPPVPPPLNPSTCTSSPLPPISISSPLPRTSISSPLLTPITPFTYLLNIYTSRSPIYLLTLLTVPTLIPYTLPSSSQSTYFSPLPLVLMFLYLLLYLSLHSTFCTPRVTSLPPSFTSTVHSSLPSSSRIPLTPSPALLSPYPPPPVILPLSLNILPKCSSPDDAITGGPKYP
ncbi:hypothetical protein Pcinc_001836 [Petrolisthes cinctipes]|uniref:Uncharacterized protein n=1 Tax=Petrolisthes cinctipes TaxID=88211 RepID=A0AAE1GKG8_PETCI|nr:hypothetical protein Pcinc_001836 [Petrolisthes cinctipes]